MRLLPVLLWNLAALVPIWLDAWGVFAVLGLYWFENLCTGLAQYRKLRDVERFRPEPGAPFAPSEFFALHYGLFTAVHGLLVLVFFGVIAGGLWDSHAGWWISALIVAAMQVADYWMQWHARAGWAGARVASLMVAPYARAAVLHVVVIFGGWLALSSDEPRTILLLFAGLKFAAELATALLWKDSDGQAAFAARR